MIKKYLNHKGLSLVEVVISALLLTVVLAALFLSYRNAKNVASLAMHKLVALTWAQSRIENSKCGVPGAFIDPAVPNKLTIEKAGAVAVATTNWAANTGQMVSVTIQWTE